MSDRNFIAVLEGRDSRNLARHLTRWGYSIVVVENMIKALDRVDHHNFAAVIVDGNGTIDALEFVLNVREIDESLPVIIVRPSIEKEVDRILREKSRVYFIPAGDDDFDLKVKDTLLAARR